jgi:hypothetical protein
MTCLSGLCQRRGSLEFAVAFAFLATLASAQTPGLDPAGLRAINVEVSAATYRGRSATRVIERQASPEVAGGESIAILPGPDFVKGVIELDVVGRLAQGAGEAARGFVGLAFDVTEGGSRFKSFYLRPTNGRATDQLRRNHSTQYTSIPEHPWNRLRKEEPGFEGGLSRWVVEGRDAVSIHRTATSHGAVLRLQSNGDVHALIRGSEAWGNLAIEGELLFPDGADSYLGVAYNFRRRGPRTDFGLLYLKYRGAGLPSAESSPRLQRVAQALSGLCRAAFGVVQDPCGRVAEVQSGGRGWRQSLLCRRDFNTSTHL